VSRQAKISAGSRESDSAHERCLVIGYDRGEAAQRAVQWAVRQLPASGRLVIVFACKGLHIPSLRGERERRRFAGAAIDELLLEADALLDREIATEISERDPVNALLEAAARHSADAIVLGAQRHSPVRRAIGTVTGELLKRSTVAITIVPAATPELIAEAGPGEDV
jgi:nucleotide-binding universal stress UspA family protein